MSSLYLKHYGVKGMKWGVRKKREKKSKDQKDKEKQEKKQQKAQKKAQKKWDRSFSRNYITIYNKAVDSSNEDLARINKKYPKVDTVEKGKKYATEVVKAYNKAYTKAIKDTIGESPNGQTDKIKWYDEKQFVDSYASWVAEDVVKK